MAEISSFQFVKGKKGLEAGKAGVAESLSAGGDLHLEKGYLV